MLGADSPFRDRAFLRYWLARVFSISGYLVQSVAIAWQIYALTDSAVDLGLVGLVQFLPRVLLLPVVGNAADRYDRRQLMLASQVVQGIAILVLTLACASDNVSRELLFFIVLVTGAARTLEMPATQSLLPALVTPATLPRAVALSAAATQTATIVAPALGGLLFAFGATSVYAVATAMFCVAVMSTVRLASPPQTRIAVTVSGTEHFMAGIRFIARERAILGAISLDLFAVLLGGATALLPIIARDILDTGPWGLGLLRSAPAVGALAVSFWLAHHPLENSVGKWMFGCVALFGVATIAFGLSRSMTVSMISLLVLGGADMVSVVIRNAYIQLQTPDAMRGRVSAVNSMFVGASNQLGEFESGLTAAWLGTVPAVVLGGIGTLLVVVVWMRVFPELWHAQRLER